MKEKVKKPAGLKRDPLGCSKITWARAWRSATVTWDARRGVCGSASLKAADGDHLVPRPDSDGEGAGAVAQDCVGAVV